MERSRDHNRTYAEIEQTIGLDHSEGKGEVTHLCSLFSKLSALMTQPSKPCLLRIQPDLLAQKLGSG